MAKRTLLSLWRTTPKAALRRRPEIVDDLKAALLPRIVPGSDDERRVLDRLIRGEDNEALLALARRIGGLEPHRSDTAMSLALAAALQDSELAAAVLAQALVERASEFEQRAARRRRTSHRPSRRAAAAHRFAARRMLRVALSWSPEVSTSFLAGPGSWRRNFERLEIPMPSLEAAAQPSGNAAGLAPPLPRPDQPALTVVRAIGDPESLDGETIARIYARLTLPLPLRGGTVDPEILAAALGLEFSHLSDAIGAVTQDLRLRRRAGAVSTSFRPLLLLGPAGTGKTRFARRLARLLGVGCGELSGAGSSDDRMLRGTARGWRGAQPAFPLLVKAGGSPRNGDVRQTLLPLLERETARTWYDECLLAPCDLSNVSWICTANEIFALPGPLLDRLHVVRCERPGPEAFDGLLASVLRDVARSLDIEPGSLPALTPAVIDNLRRAFARRGDLRMLRRLAEVAIANAAIALRDTH